jgi:acetylglutamate kinase
LRLVIKVGGTLLDAKEARAGLAQQLAQVAHAHEIVVVHGGGKQVTQFLQERGVQSRFVSGLRVSDEAVVDAVTKVIAGGVNKQLVSALLAAGQRAVGLSGIDGLLTAATALDPVLEFVGRPERTDARLLELLTNSGYLPVIACVAADERGIIYNVNADQMAVSVAIAWRPAKLLFLTDVSGVKDRTGAILARLTVKEASELVRSGVASGGMQAKLEAATRALEAGIAEVLIVPGHEADICARVLAGQEAGTRLTLDPVASRETIRT